MEVNDEKQVIEEDIEATNVDLDIKCDLNNEPLLDRRFIIINLCNLPERREKITSQ